MSLRINLFIISWDKLLREILPEFQKEGICGYLVEIRTREILKG